MDKLRFDTLVNNLKGKEKCVLVLGPEFINIDTNKNSFTESIQNYLITIGLKEELKDNLTQYLSDDGFFYFGKDDDEYMYLEFIMSKITEFYRSREISSYHKLLSEIPFDIIISLSPDDLLHQACKNIGKEPVWRHYKGGNNLLEDAPSEISTDNPLIYNLCGHYEDKQSMLFTFDNLFNFLRQFYQKPILPNFQRHIKETNNFLYLGFAYDKWYIKLLLDVLNNFQDANARFSKSAVLNFDPNKPDKQIDFFNKSFRLKFSPSDEREFINKLHHTCSKEGILFKPKPIQNTSRATDAQYKVFFLGSSPKGTNGAIMQLDLATEIELIEQQLLNKNITFESKVNGKINDISEIIRDFDTDLIYFSMHGTGDTLKFCDENRNEYPVSLNQIVTNLLFLNNSQKNKLKVIVFSACESEEAAREISKNIKECYCIGMSESIDEEASFVFTKGFFLQFSKNKDDVTSAVKKGKLDMYNHPRFKPFSELPVIYYQGEKIQLT